MPKTLSQHMAQRLRFITDQGGLAACFDKVAQLPAGGAACRDLSVALGYAAPREVHGFAREYANALFGEKRIAKNTTVTISWPQLVDDGSGNAFAFLRDALKNARGGLLVVQGAFSNDGNKHQNEKADILCRILQDWIEKEQGSPVLLAGNAADMARKFGDRASTKSAFTNRIGF